MSEINYADAITELLDNAGFDLYEMILDKDDMKNTIISAFITPDAEIGWIPALYPKFAELWYDDNRLLNPIFDNGMVIFKVHDQMSDIKLNHIIDLINKEINNDKVKFDKYVYENIRNACDNFRTSKWIPKLLTLDASGTEFIILEKMDACSIIPYSSSDNFKIKCSNGLLHVQGDSGASCDIFTENVPICIIHSDANHFMQHLEYESSTIPNVFAESIVAVVRTTIPDSLFENITWYFESKKWGVGRIEGMVWCMYADDNVFGAIIINEANVSYIGRTPL